MQLEEKIARRLAWAITGLDPDTLVLPKLPDPVPSDLVAAHVVDPSKVVPLWTVFLDAALVAVQTVKAEAEGQ